MSIRVVVGICTKNAEKTIKECILSIISQKYPEQFLKIIIVDGDSKDRTLQIADSLLSKTQLQTKVYSDNGQGLGKARQIIVEHADSKYAIFVDADVRLFDDFVKGHVDFMEKNPSIGVALGRPMYKKKGTLMSTVAELENYTVGGNIGTEATGFRLEALLQAGGFDTNIRGAAEDIDLINRIREGGWLVDVNEKARFYHKCRDSLKGFWNEHTWFGYGEHYLIHKNKNSNPLWRKLPFGAFIYGSRIAMKAYKQTYLKISFIIPFQMVFSCLAWWFGYTQAHIAGYGHTLS